MIRSLRLRNSLLLTTVFVSLISPSAIAQQTGETPRSQIEDVLDKTTNRAIIEDVIGGYGEEGKKLLLEIASDEH